jgi:hypothetical protein
MLKQYGNNMRLFTSYWGDADTFKLMPVTDDCPYAEVIYDPSTTLLVVISKLQKDNFQTVPRLDEDGTPIKAKKPKLNGIPHKEQRIVMSVLQEYYIVNKEEQEEFIKDFAINASSFPYSKYLRDLDEEANITPIKQPTLVNEKGLPLK